MEKEQFYAYFEGEKGLNEESLLQLKKLTKKYPYFQTAQMMLLKNMKETLDSEFMLELNKVAITCADREKLFYYLSDERFDRFFLNVELENNAEEDRTDLLLNSFLNSIGEKDEVEEKANSKSEDHLENDSIISTDYLAYLEKTESEENQSDSTQEVKPMKHQQLLDNFLEKSSGDESLFSNKNREEKGNRKLIQGPDSLLDDDAFLTETLAQVYIKQKKYEQALTIIKRLSLNFPKKSIYFADQIRFLEYLIYNDKNKKQK